MTGPNEGEVTIRMACQHGTDELRFTASVNDAQAIAVQAQVLAAQHGQSFDCQCEIGVLINGEDEIQRPILYLGSILLTFAPRYAIHTLQGSN